ncbi:hypothetical protein ACFQY8_01695 [Alloscardovia venturai]|uniref:Uncharacterized protein n=1 Tax=Alloscardovia venturai TaxID=1769421 RepID=A0ABW2Y353_9BIFI
MRLMIQRLTPQEQIQLQQRELELQQEEVEQQRREDKRYILDVYSAEITSKINTVMKAFYSELDEVAYTAQNDITCVLDALSSAIEGESSDALKLVANEYKAEYNKVRIS